MEEATSTPVPEEDRQGRTIREEHMMRPFSRRSACAALILSIFLAGCGPPTKEDLIRTAGDVKTRAELEKRLGRPGDISKLGPVETWTYKGRNGDVVFLILGDTVALQAAGPGEKKNEKKD